MSTSTLRAVGYCSNKACDQVWRGVFLLNHGPKFNCPECRVTGELVPEKNWTEGDSPIFRQVRVEFGYDAERSRYKSTAIVIDDDVGEDSSVFYLESPLIKTENRALKVAESIMGQLARGEQPGLKYSRETVIDLSAGREIFKRSLQEVESRWLNNPRNSYVKG